MILLNFAHPLNSKQISEIERIAGQQIIDHREYKVNFDHEQSFASQAEQLVNQVGLSSQAWQNDQLLINLPAHSLIAAVLLAELHGRIGYFPAVIRLKPVNGPLGPVFELAEILNLQTIREKARSSRLSSP